MISQPMIQHCAVPEKNPYPPHGRSLEIPRGEVKILEAKYEAKLEFPRGTGGAKQETFHWGEYVYFLELHIILNTCTCMCFSNLDESETWDQSLFVSTC